MIANRLVGKLHNSELKPDFTRNDAIKKIFRIAKKLLSMILSSPQFADQFIILLT